MENECLRRNIKRVSVSSFTPLLLFGALFKEHVLIHACLTCQEVESAQRLKVSKLSLEVTNEKLEAELEATNQRLREALSRPAVEMADRKTGRASVVTRSAFALHTGGRGVPYRYLPQRYLPHRYPSISTVTTSVIQSNLTILFSHHSCSAD